jgi:Bacterial capsule synthesis protein PGA_cap
MMLATSGWGEEGNPCPIGPQRRLARLLARVGADIVVGTHAHTLQGSGWLGRTYVAYGLGRRSHPAHRFSCHQGSLALCRRTRVHQPRCDTPVTSPGAGTGGSGGPLSSHARSHAGAGCSGPLS